MAKPRGGRGLMMQLGLFSVTLIGGRGLMIQLGLFSITLISTNNFSNRGTAGSTTDSSGCGLSSLKLIFVKAMLTSFVRSEEAPNFKDAGMPVVLDLK